MNSTLNVRSEAVLAVNACNVLSKPAVHGTVTQMQYRENNKSESQPRLGTTENKEEEE